MGSGVELPTRAEAWRCRSCAHRTRAQDGSNAVASVPSPAARSDLLSELLLRVVRDQVTERTCRTSRKLVPDCAKASEGRGHVSHVLPCLHRRSQTRRTPQGAYLTCLAARRRDIEKGSLSFQQRSCERRRWSSGQPSDCQQRPHGSPAQGYSDRPSTRRHCASDWRRKLRRAKCLAWTKLCQAFEAAAPQAGPRAFL